MMIHRGGEGHGEWSPREHPHPGDSRGKRAEEEKHGERPGEVHISRRYQ